ncbi:uncharacterized protein (TIGR02646 family) [Sphingomonas sp. PP-F2F-A104-K0414]|nr:uncharacterized protein (TIGR02646 family) [Sphingomonas sp. PP-F2F-A104-K0414]
MIQLSRPASPPELDEPTVTALTTEFVNTGTSVWNTPSIRSGLLNSSNSKCAFCETKLDEESKYMEVEHFRCKRDFPDMVVDWDNLLPACKRCNVRKGGYNVDMEGMIVNPFDVDPRNHMFLYNFRLRSRDVVGRSTIDTLYLNQSDRLVAVRSSIGEAVASALERIREYLEDYIAGQKTVRQQNRIIRGIEKLLVESSPQAEYSATTSTVLFGDPDFSWIRERLQERGLWDSLVLQEGIARACAMLP